MPRRPPVATRLLALGLLPLAGCASEPTTTAPLGPVVVTPVPSLAGSAAATCSAVTADLPEQLAPGVARRATSPVSAWTAAWGEPAITLRCGAEPSSPRDERYGLDGVRWSVHDTGATRTWTTVDARVPVAVVVPDAYENQGELVAALGPALGPTLR